MYRGGTSMWCQSRIACCHDTWAVSRRFNQAADPAWHQKPKTELLTCCTGQEASVEHNNGKVNFILNGFSDNTDTDNDFFHAAEVCTLQMHKH